MEQVLLSYAAFLVFQPNSFSPCVIKINVSSYRKHNFPSLYRQQLQMRFPTIDFSLFFFQHLNHICLNYELRHLLLISRDSIRTIQYQLHVTDQQQSDACSTKCLFLSCERYSIQNCLLLLLGKTECALCGWGGFFFFLQSWLNGH